MAALESILRQRSLRYATADSEKLGAMSDAELTAHRLLIVPGGNFEQIGNALTAGTAAKLRNAVASGLSYLGICAGAFFIEARVRFRLNFDELVNAQTEQRLLVIRAQSARLSLP